MTECQHFDLMGCANDEEVISAAADKIISNPKGWLPGYGHVVNVTFTIEESDRLVASLHAAKRALATSQPNRMGTTPEDDPSWSAVHRAKNALFNLARMHGYRLNDVELGEAVRAVARALAATPSRSLMGTTPEMQRMYDEFGGDELMTSDPAPITTEQLDKLQFGRVLHERPATPAAGGLWQNPSFAERNLIDRFGRHPKEQPAADPVTEWQPIETAPRNGRDILMSCGFGEPTRIAFWDDARGGIWSLWPGRERLYYPRHWMPLPTAPEETT